jgi:hypothetical protein
MKTRLLRISFTTRPMEKGQHHKKKRPKKRRKRRRRSVTRERRITKELVQMVTTSARAIFCKIRAL